MSEEKDLGQIEDNSPGSDEGFGGLEDFVELDDLQNLEGLADLSGLGDISDLGDLSDLPDVSMESGSLDDLDTELDIQLPVMEETEDNSQEEEIAEITGAMDASVSALEEPEEITAIPEETVITEEEETETVPLIPEEAETEAETEEKTDNAAEETDGLSLEMADNIEEPTEDVPVPEEEETNAEGAAQGTEEDDILPDGISLDPDIPGIMEEDMPEVQEPLPQEEPAAEEDPGFMPEGILDSLGIDNIPGEETTEDGTGVEETGDNSDGLDGILDSLGVPEAVPAMEEEVPKKTEPVEQEEAEEEKKPGFFKRVFGNVVTDEIAEAERKAKEEEEEQAVLKAEEEAKAKEEKEAKKAAAAEAKEAKKAAKAAKKAEKAEAKAAKKAEKAAKKEAEKEAEEQEVVGKLNKTGVIIVTAGAAILLAGVITGTNIFGYNYSKSEAERYFTLQRYSDAYNEARGTKLKDKEPELYDKIITVMKVQQSIDTYSSYAEMKYYPDALNALLRGLQKYDENIDMAMDLEIEGDMKVCKNRILSILKDEFGLSEKKAYDILSLDNTAYTKRVVGIAKKKI
ncbi:MAG: hypothetical protein K1W24_14195 [Lachnospiraceae bacterium]